VHYGLSFNPLFLFSSLVSYKNPQKRRKHNYTMFCIHLEAQMKLAMYIIMQLIITVFLIFEVLRQILCSAIKINIWKISHFFLRILFLTRKPGAYLIVLFYRSVLVNRSVLDNSNLYKAKQLYYSTLQLKNI